MSENDNEKLPYDKAIGDVFGIINCLLLISEIGSYQQWLIQVHQIDLSQDYFKGYRLIFDTLFRLLVAELERNQSLHLTTDDMFRRATFSGKPVMLLPNTCEKTILLKNLRQYYREVMNTKSWSTFNKSIQKVKAKVFIPFSKLNQVSALNNKYPINDLDLVIRYSSMFQVYLFLNDTSRDLPHGYLPAMIDDKEVTFGYQYQVLKSVKDSFNGYKFGVQYLWYKLLENTYTDSVVSNLHKTNDWQSFDSYFRSIQTQIIKPIEKQTRGHSGYDFFIFIDGDPHNLLSELLEPKTSDKPLSPKERIRRLFLWYPLSVINSSQYNFTGIPVLIPLLNGMVQQNESFEEKTKVTMIRIIHGTAEEHRRSYSYAVLSGLFGDFSDASGWLLFFDCCDDQGSTSGLFNQIEKRISYYLENDQISISNIRIAKDILLQLLKEDIVSGE